MCGLDDEEVGHPFSSLNHQDDRLAYFPKVFFCVCSFQWQKLSQEVKAYFFICNIHGHPTGE